MAILSKIYKQTLENNNINLTLYLNVWKPVIK